MPLRILETSACLYWPKHLGEAIAEISSLPILLETQDQFLSVLKCSDKSPDACIKTIQEVSTLSPNLFLKHLMVLSDIGGERTQRFAKDFDILFPTNVMEYVWNGKTYTHTFGASKKSWSNKALNVEKSVLLKAATFNQDMIDVTMLLLWGSAIINNPSLPQELIDKCTIGQYIGLPEQLDEFVKQRYLVVSRITGGSQVNDLGHACEHYAAQYLRSLLPEYIIVEGHNIPNISHNDKNLVTFDLVATNTVTNKCVAIEISFQVTTNSVIERKAGLAKPRQEMLHHHGHSVAYIIDGSGNFQRKNAIETIISFSDCTVNFSDSNLRALAGFIQTATEIGSKS